MGNSFNRAAQPDSRPLEKGIFCDCYGTLFGNGYANNTRLVAYLNAQYAAKENVVIFSTDPKGMRAQVAQLGLHPDLADNIRNKLEYQHVLLEVLIDDDPSHYLRAQKLYHPHDKAFRAMILDFVTLNPPPAPPPAP